MVEHGDGVPGKKTGQPNSEGSKTPQRDAVKD